MRSVDEAFVRGSAGAWRWRVGLAGTSWALFFGSAACTSSPSGNPCLADQNGISGGKQVIDLTVSDTAFTVGAAEGGPGEPNITVENATVVTLTMSNVGTKPHDFVIRCLATPNASGCPAQSCFAADAGIPPLQPGESATTVLVAPVHEGTYPFVSDLPGDTQTSEDGGVTGLVGQFVLL